MWPTYKRSSGLHETTRGDAKAQQLQSTKKMLPRKRKRGEKDTRNQTRSAQRKKKSPQQLGAARDYSCAELQALQGGR